METGMTAWHTGNAGVVIQVTNIEEKGCAAIGFDVFAKQPGGIYPDTPEAIRQELLRDIRKKKLGTLVFTHEHADHFCPEDVAEAIWYLSSDAARFVTGQVLAPNGGLVI